MGLAFKLAFRNLIGAGLRTWLNVIVLAIAFILIVFYHGMNSGWNEQAKKETIDWQVGNGELRNNNYDPYDPFTIADGHGLISNPESKGLEPVLIRQGSIYPEGRLYSAIIKGMNVDQSVVKIPIHLLKDSKAEFPVLIGKRMAASANLKVGDEVLMRWRDAKGTYDASTVTIAAIFDCNLPAIDDGQIYMDINKLYQITGFAKNTATYFIDVNGKKEIQESGWTYLNQESLVKFIDDLAEMDAIGAMIMYSLLLAIALLAIFDTQVLSIFRRQREIGTYIALGMTRYRVVGMFTIEGSMYSIMASIMGMVLGYPLFAYFSKVGIGMGGMESGMAMAERIYPVYSLGLIVSTTILVIVSATIVSFLPAKKISKMDPVDALKGKMQ